MTPEAKRRKNQKKKLKQKQKKAAAAAAAAVIAANIATDVPRAAADVDSISTSESTVIFKDNTVTDEANMNTVSNSSISKDNTNQEEERGNIIQENKEENKIRVEPEKFVEIIESSLEIGSHQIISEENTQVQEIEQHDKSTELTNQMVDYQNSDQQIVNTAYDQEINNNNFNKEMSDPQNLNVDGHLLTDFDEEVAKGNDLNKITTNTEELENKLTQLTSDFNEIINRSEEEHNETNNETAEDKEIEYKSSAEDVSIQNESQFSEKLVTVDKKSELLHTNTVTQNENKTLQEVEEHQRQTHEDLQESIITKQHIEDVDFSTIFHSEDLSTNYDWNQNNEIEVSNRETALTQSESISEKRFTTKENTIEDLFMSSPHDALMPWEQQEKVHQNREKEYLQNVADEHCERETGPIGKVDELFANENAEGLLPWNENKANEETKISDDVIDHGVYSIDASIVSTSNNENGNSQKDNNNEHSPDVSGLFGEETNRYNEYWLHKTDNSVPSSPFTTTINTVESTNDISTALNPEPIKSTVNDSFKKFSFLQDDNDLLDDDSDSFLESGDELATQSEDRPQSDISSAGIILDGTYRNDSNGQVHNTSRYTPITSDIMASNKNILPTRESMVGIVLPKQINHISKTVSDIQPSQSPAIQLPNQDPIRSSFNPQNAKQVIEKLSVEKKKSDAYDFPMDLIMDKIKPVHAKPVGVPSPKLNSTSFLPKNLSRHTSTSIQSTSGYQSLNAVSNMSMPMNPYAVVVKKENTSKQGAPPAAPVGVVLPSINLPSLPTFQNNNKKMVLSMNSPPPHGNRKNISNTSSAPSIHPAAIPNTYSSQTGVIRAPPKRTSQPLQYAHQSSTTVQSSQVPPSNIDPHRSVSVSQVSTNSSFVLSASRGNHARKNSSLYSPNSNENSSRYAPTVRPQYQQQSQTIQSNITRQQFPSIPATLESNTTKPFVQQINHSKNTYPYSSHPIKNDNTLVESNVVSQLDPYSGSQINHMGLSHPVSEGNYINKQLRNHSNETMSEVDNVSLFSRQFPLFQFNSSSKIVYGIPIAMGGYTGTEIPAISSLNIKSYDFIVKPDPVLKSFPGPLTQKTKRKDVEKWLSTIIGEINVDINSDEYLIWKILQIKFLEDYSTNDLSEAIYSTHELQTYLSQPFNPSLSQLNAYRLDNAGLMRILALLQVGDHNSALRDALFHKDYTMALLIGSLISKDKWVDVVDLYFAEEVNNPTCINLLSLIFQAFMGNSKAIIDKFYSNNERATWMLNNWRVVVAAVLKHCIHYDNANKIPPVIIEFLVELAIFLYHKGLKLVASVLFIIVDIPLTNIPVLKDSDVTFTYIGNPISVQGIVWSELYQCYCVMQNPKLSNCDVLLLQKTYHGMCLQEQGLSNLATKYSDYVASRLKQLNKKDVASLNLSSKLEELQSRLIGSNSGWLLKPKLSSVWGQLDKSFNKYIGGDDDTSPTPSDTFGKFMVGNKGVISSPSSNAFNNYIGDNVETSSVVMCIGKMPSRPNIYSPNKQSYIKKPIERPSLVPASQTFSTPNVLEVVKPSSIKPDIYSLNANNSVPSKLSNHFDVERSPKQIDEEIASTIASEKGNETLEEHSIPILLPKETQVMASLIDDGPTELQSMQYSIPLPVDNNDASLIENADIVSVSKDGSNVPPRIISDAHEQKVENVSAANSLVDIDNSQPLENNSSGTVMRDNEVPYLFTSIPVSQQADRRVFSSESVTNDPFHKTEDEVEPDIGVSKNIDPPSVSQGSASYPAAQISMKEAVNSNNLNDRVTPNPVTISTKYNNFVSPDTSIKNMDGFEPRIRPSSEVQGVPSVKTSEEINIRYNDEVEDDSDEEVEEEIANTKKDTVTKDKDKKNNTSSQKSGWFSWLKKDPNDKKVVKAKLGHQNNFYYDEKLKRWVNKDATEDEKKKMQEAVAPPPPPIVRRKDTVIKSKPRPSFSHPSTNSTSSAPGGTPPVTILPANPLSGQPMIQTSNNFSSTKPKENSIIPNPPPVTNGNKSINLAGKTSNGLDDILNISKTTTASRRKKKPGRGYVNVMENR